MLRRLGLLTSGKGGRINNGRASKQAAAFNAIAHALNEREIPTALDGRWHSTSVRRLLERLERLDRASRSKHRR